MNTRVSFFDAAKQKKQNYLRISKTKAGNSPKTMSEK